MNVNTFAIIFSKLDWTSIVINQIIATSINFDTRFDICIY